MSVKPCLNVHGWNMSFHTESCLTSVLLALAQPQLERGTDGKQPLNSSLNQMIDTSVA